MSPPEQVYPLSEPKQLEVQPIPSASYPSSHISPADVTTFPSPHLKVQLELGKEEP